ncbi:xanthine dehydrogenase small subunit [Curvibacter sp. APW13]|uniref:xanthine dehydrogenase small subunit n=1 Tax=Curvibacter sp. APW13 TaxID=3077236 RepID=UPI0028DFBADC|nr:xanthine dehydrogenase small subunit [Curvibacter sp. APW13]MDT8991107.1 xanthine dehydrogenase small subunit [Curvibacter sp. APW13]
MNHPPLRILRRGETITLHNVPPERTLLEVLREDLHSCGTKEGCGEGDCGACTVVLGQEENGQLRTRAVNSCIKPAHAANGMALWTVEDLVQPDGSLHPTQQAMAQCHASQCGFCTPGFVMSLFSLYQNHTLQGETVSREQAAQALSGNLCRCTGYRPILDAAESMQTLPRVAVDEVETLSKLKLLAQELRGPEPDSTYISPTTLKDLLQTRARHPQAQLVAGCTDVGLWITKMHKEFGRIIDLTRVAELQRVETYPHHIAIGAAVSLTDAFAALVADRPQLTDFAHRFAGQPVRNAGTLGGNVANGSPIGDSMPLLIALGANVVLMRWEQEKNGKGQIRHREMPLEKLYTGYRQNVFLPNEVLAWIKVPRPTASELTRSYKISKRFEDDISAVCLVLSLHIVDGVVHQASIGAGGVAATPARAAQTEAALRGQPWNMTTVQRAQQVLRAEFSPISDMRASSDYRRTVLGNLLQRFWLESQGQALVEVRQLRAEGAHA